MIPGIAREYKRDRQLWKKIPEDFYGPKPEFWE